MTRERSGRRRPHMCPAYSIEDAVGLTNPSPGLVECLTTFKHIVY